MEPEVGEIWAYHVTSLSTKGAQDVDLMNG